ncbi:MAG TPA: TetR/AcrR family transcriptional regulator [Bacteroidetes bacterium]|nr:TetR/AcrR family transcriptional regulator [Bacteroidota bacterium]
MKSKRQQIKDHAARLFRKRGYKATSMRDLAKEVGMEAASLYNHIQSKQELLRELLMEMAQLFTTGMEEVQTSPLGPQEKLERLIAQYIRFTVEHTDAISLITSEWVHLEGPAKEAYTLLRDRYEDNFRQVLTDCIEQGHFREMDVGIALFSTLSSLRWLYSWYSKHRDVNPLELEKEMTGMLLDGLRK